MEINTASIRRGGAVLLAAALAAIALFMPFPGVAEDAGHAFTAIASPLKNSTDLARAQDVQNVFRKIYELYSERVVFISTEQTVNMQQHPFLSDPFFREFFGMPEKEAPRTQKRTGLGTGFVLTEDGYICTNHHVVAGVDKVKVKLGSATYDAVVVGSDERTDVALLKIEPKEKLKPAFLGNSDSVRVGDWAIAIGNPFGLDKTFTMGVVSATGRQNLGQTGGSQGHIQTDASINPGNSGGPLINIDGEVIGINRMIYSQTGGSLGIGFAIPINTAMGILDQLKTHKKIVRGFIGVQIVPLTEEYAKELGLPTAEGALVGAVVQNGPADKAGMKVGDVILSINNRKVKTYFDLVDEVEKTAAGKTVRVEIRREKGTMTLFLTIEEKS
ncbi:MAG: trypsin-like serine protease [Spirochaetes bacterium]|nr:MAG: trypsin-like serine protease [Spirochaetota bacterium]